MRAGRKHSVRTDSGLRDRHGTAVAFRSPAAIIIFLAAAAGGLTADLLTKQQVFESLLADPRVAPRVVRLRVQCGPDLTTHQAIVLLRQEGLLQRRVAPGVRFTLSTNPGVVFGWRMPQWAVIIATVLTLALVGYFFSSSDRTARAVHLALGLILGGAVGNLYDRMFGEVALVGLPAAEPIRRQVRDFIDCSGLYYPWVFNVADALLVVGVALLIVRWWSADRHAKPKENK